MIKINLCPLDELESPYWYVPDVIAASLVAAVVFFAMQFYLGTIQDQIDVVTSEAASLEESTAKLLPDLEKFKNLGKDIADLNGKLSALQSITVSKIAKYKPVIVLEHLQNLKPEGVWFESVRIGFSAATAKGATGAQTPTPGQGPNAGQELPEDGFEIRGQAFDNILTAEFMTAIRSTETQEIDAGDLRTQVFFTELALVDASIAKGAGGRGFQELSVYPVFNLRGHFAERSVAASPVPHEQPPIGAKRQKLRPPGAGAAPGQLPANPEPEVSLRSVERTLDDDLSDVERSRRF